jgi:hypothetical protein
MSFQFPPNPNLNEQVLADNNVLYEWDGVKWIVAGERRPPPAFDPSDFLLRAGGTMTGALTLAADPVAAMQPVTRQYFEANAPTPDLSSLLPLTGGTLTGPVTLAADPAAAMQPVTLQYLEANAGRVTVSDAEPLNPREGELWWDSTEGQLYVNYDGLWVIAVNQMGAFLSDAPRDGKAYVRRDGAWVALV